MSYHSPTDLSLSPSRLARAFEFSCDRRLRLSLTRPESLPEPWRSVLRDSADAEAQSATTQGIFKSGFLWEERALSTLIDPSILVAPPGDEPLSERRWSGAKESLRALAESKAGQLIYQLELTPPRALYHELGLEPDAIEITRNFPDLIQVLTESELEPVACQATRSKAWLRGASDRCAPESRVFRVIDLKRSARVKTSHQIQTLFYALELQLILNEAQIPGRVDLSWGGVWLGDTPSPEYFRIDALRPYFTELTRRLPALLTRPLSEVKWSLQAECEWCPFHAECARQARVEDRVTRLAGITPRAVQFLEDLGVSNLAQLRSLLEREDADETLARCATLEGKRRRLSARITAYETRRPIPSHGVAPHLPRSEDIRIFLTAHHEGVARRPWALGLRVAQTHLHLDLGGADPITRVYLARNEADSKTIALEWSELLCDCLCELDTMNQGRPWSDQVSAQLYCYSALERRIIIDMLLTLRDDPQAHPRLGEVIIHLQGSALLEYNQHPKRLSETPLVTLLSELGSLLVLPIDKAYTLSEVSELLGLSTSYPRDPALHFPYGHQLRSDLALESWATPTSSRDITDTALERCERDLIARLATYDELLKYLRHTCRGQLVRWPCRFGFPDSSPIMSPMLSKLAYLSALDTRAQREETRTLRFTPHAELTERGHLIKLKANSGDHFTMICAPIGTRLKAGGYSSFLLVEDSPRGLRDAASFVDDDITRSWGEIKRHTRGVNHVNVEILNPLDTRVEDDLVGATLGLSACGADGLTVVPNQTYLLIPRYKSHQLGQLETCLYDLDDATHPRPLFLELLDDPQSAQRDLRCSRSAYAHLDALKSQAHLTPSQDAAWDHVFSHRITAIWGPPGTGKTHLLASLIVGALDVAAREHETCHIYVSAMTHTAIENLMTKCAQRLAELRPHLSPLLAKLDRWERSARPSEIKIIDKRRLEGELRNAPLALIGGTQWASQKIKRRPFDLMVIDEASQVLVSHSALGISRVKPSGRLVVAGDHMQLGPILSEEAHIEGDHAYLSGSVLDLIRDRPERPGVKLSQLLENWRMNQALTKQAHLIYGSRYRCANDIVATRQLNSRLMTSLITPDSTAIARLYTALPIAYHSPELQALFERPRSLLTACLNPERPLTVLSVRGLEVGRSNPIEAALVALLAYTLRLNPERAETEALRAGQPRDDESFWSEEVFMISPHHSQLETLRKLYTTLHTSTVPPFAQTVEKAQGQEADTLLITYGVSDLDYAQAESSFIYNLNRLNVSITRARAKAVVCLPEPLLRGSAQLINDPRSVGGLSYMQYLEARAHEGQVDEFNLGGGRALRVMSI